MSDKSPVVLILAAGRGTRMKSEKTKVLHEVAGRPLIVWSVEAARAVAATRIVAILGHQHDRVASVLDERYGQDVVDIALQVEQRGTGHAVLCGLAALNREPDDLVVVILSGDAPLFGAKRISALVDACERSASGMALCATCPPIPMPYGRLLRNAEDRLLRVVEDRDADVHERAIEEMNAGFYAVRLGHLRADLAELRADNAQGELYLTDLVARAATRGGATVIEAPFDEVHGINDRIDLARVDALARHRINHAWMAAGVTLQAPENTFIDADAGPLECDVWLGASVHLRGKTRAGRGVRIDTGCVLTNTRVAAGVYIKPHSVLTDTTIGPSAEIGPFTHCRPGTTVDEGVKLGNFVETKKAHFMTGAKANHHAYLGDVSVGARANVGAGVITCNYDGFSKHTTVIEAGAFIGTDSQLIAPVTVGRDAYVGAGTTVTRDVPRSSLALTRVKQVNVEGWAERFRQAQEKRKDRGK
jgi:bifunctional UDP-N-acetylglucosamine pyrophosphorylase/glucosamine-1-phosphate N-acetyltransferase